MFAQQVPGGLLHGAQVQGCKNPADAAMVYAGPHWRLQQHIGIAAGQGAGATVKFIRYRMRPLNCDVAWQERVGTAHPGRTRAIESGVEMDHLHQAVHAGIGAPSAQGRHLVRAELTQRQLELILDGFP